MVVRQGLVHGVVGGRAETVGQGDEDHVLAHRQVGVVGGRVEYGGDPGAGGRIILTEGSAVEEHLALEGGLPAGGQP